MTLLLIHDVFAYSLASAEDARLRRVTRETFFVLERPGNVL